MIFSYDVRAEPADLRALLSDDERHRADQFRHDDDRRRFTVAHARLRQLLAERTGRDPAALRFAAGPHGKPFLCGGGIEFSLSHSADIVLIAVAERPVGADVECVMPRANLAHIAQRSFTADEQAWLGDQRDAAHAFFRIWTMKEAALKGDGAGISLGLSNAAVDVATLDRVLVRGEPWSVREVDLPAGYCGAVAMRA